MKEFESVRMKIMKLVALAEAGVGGEAVNARRMLQKLMDQHGIHDVASLFTGVRTVRHLEVNPACGNRTPKKDKELCRLAVQCLRFVCDTKEVTPVEILEADISYVRGSRVKTGKIYRIGAEVTEAEFEDWRDCFQHYAPEFIDTRSSLERRIAEARKAVLDALVNQHNIFPSDAVVCAPGEVSQERRAAFILARAAVTGEKWRKCAGKLGQSGSMLEHGRHAHHA